MKTIPLSQNKVALVDDVDYLYLSQFTWNYHGKQYASRNFYKNGRQTIVLMHREIMNPGKLHVDHINRNGLDNRRGNLRLATNEENRRNAKIRSDNTSGFRGVWKNSSGKYKAEIKYKSKKYHLGVYPTAGEAALAYNEAATRLHKDFASLN